MTRKELDALKAKYQESIDHLSYRGFEIDFYEDIYGKQIFTFWQEKELSFGINNTLYKDDMKLYIDNYLDTIYNFNTKEDEKYIGAKLKYFNNAGFKDIILYYKKRIIKVFIVVGTIDTEKLIEDSKLILDKIILPEE